MLHADALGLLRGWEVPDPEQDRLRRRYVSHLEQRPDGLQRDCHPAHITAGALILSPDGERVLLTLHAKARSWFQMGGHCEPGDTTLAGAARREAVEESGLADLVVDPQPIHLDAHVVPFCAPGRQVEHLDVRFLASAPEDAVHRVSEESLDVRWWPHDDLPTQDQDMLELVRAARARWTVSGGPGRGGGAVHGGAVGG